MRGVPLRCPYLYTIKRNKSASDLSCLQTYYTRNKTMTRKEIEEKLEHMSKMEKKMGRVERLLIAAVVIMILALIAMVYCIYK